MAEPCRNCYDLQYTIRVMEGEANERRIVAQELGQRHQDEIDAMQRKLDEQNAHNAMLGALIAQRDRLYKDCKEVLAFGSNYERLRHAVDAYERIKDTDTVPALV